MPRFSDQFPFGDVVSHVQGKFLDVGVAVENVEDSATGQVVGSQGGIVVRVKSVAGRVRIGTVILLKRANVCRGRPRE